MQITKAAEPAEAVAKAINTELERYQGHATLLLLAGGSALDVLKHIATENLTESTTIMMMDERFSRSSSENSFLQMMDTPLYEAAKEKGCAFIPSIPDEKESHVDFAKRINEELQSYVQQNPKGKCFALFGVGTDGHTGAIFPMPEEDFLETYSTGDLYVPVSVTANTFTERSSITPLFIASHITKSFLYATGEEKREVLITLQMQRELHEMPAMLHDQIGSELFTDLAI